jgi:hypothetical protein
MVMLPNWLDAEYIPVENGSGDEEIPKASKNRWSSGKYRLMSPDLKDKVITFPRIHEDL